MFTLCADNLLDRVMSFENMREIYTSLATPGNSELIHPLNRLRQQFLTIRHLSSICNLLRQIRNEATIDNL